MDLRHDYGCDKNEKDICTCGADDVYHQKARIAELEAKLADTDNKRIMAWSQCSYWQQRYMDASRERAENEVRGM